jgi:hypothetical protein
LSRVRSESSINLAASPEFGRHSVRVPELSKVRFIEELIVSVNGENRQDEWETGTTESNRATSGLDVVATFRLRLRTQRL